MVAIFSSPRPDESILRDELSPMVPVVDCLRHENQASLSNGTVQLVLDIFERNDLALARKQFSERFSVTPAGKPPILAVNVVIALSYYES